MFPGHPANDSSKTVSEYDQEIPQSQTADKLSRLMSELCCFKCLKLYLLNFVIAHAQI